LGPNIVKAHPNKILGAKTCKIWLAFRRLQTSIANISGTAEDIQHRTSTLLTVIPSAFGEKFGELSTNDEDVRMESYPPKLTFLNDHILAPRGSFAPRFLYVLENDQVLLAHSQTHFGLCPKFSVVISSPGNDNFWSRLIFCCGLLSLLILFLLRDL